MPGFAILQVSQGETYDLQLTLKDSNGDTLDLTGCSAELNIFIGQDEEEVLSPTVTIDEEDNVIQVHLSVEETEALEVGEYKYDFYLNSDGDVTVTKFLEGTFVVSGRVG